MNYITETMSWIGKNILDIALVFVGASAFITYKLQVKKEQKTAATLVVKQIQDIESIIKPLKSAKQLNGEMIYRCKQIITKNYWNEYRHFLLKDMKDSYLSKIEEFYSNAEELEKSRASICNELSNTFNNKELVFQLKIAEEIISSGKYDCENSPMETYYKCKSTFLSGLPFEYMESNLRQFENLSETEAYRSLRKLSYLS